MATRISPAAARCAIGLLDAALTQVLAQFSFRRCGLHMFEETLAVSGDDVGNLSLGFGVDTFDLTVTATVP